MKLFIVAVGNKAPAWVASGFTEYVRRMPPEARIELIEVKPEPREAGKTPAQMMAAEARRILAAVPQGAKLVALDERGKDATTKDLAAKISAWQREGDDVAFIIGGPDGLAEEVKTRATLMLRLSSLTLPHALVRVILAEALYRAVSLNQGHPYHRESVTNKRTTTRRNHATKNAHHAHAENLSRFRQPAPRRTAAADRHQLRGTQAGRIRCR